MSETSNKGPVITELESMIAKISDKSASKIVKRFITSNRATAILKDFGIFLQSLVKSVTNDTTPEGGFESAAMHITEFVSLFGFDFIIKSTEFYMQKIEEMILIKGKKIRSQTKLDSKEDCLQAITGFKNVLMSLGEGDRTSQMSMLDDCFSRIVKAADILEFKTEDRKWISTCEKMLNETRSIISLANELDSLAETVGTYTSRSEKPPSIFRKRRADTSITTCGISDTQKHPFDEALAVIDRPEADRSQSHLYVYHRIDELCRENEMLRMEIAKGPSDPEYVRCLKQTNARLSEELESLQEEYERLRAEEASCDSD